jgi:cell division initiation protein
MLTPIDVQQKKFTTALRGYDLDEVDDFLDDVVTTLRDYDQRLRDAEERASVLDAELKAKRETGDAITRAFVIAQKSADGIVTDARQQADRILSSARVEATELSTSQLQEKKVLEDELAGLRTSVGDIRRRLAALAERTAGELGGFDLDRSAVAEVLEPAEEAADELEEALEQASEDLEEGLDVDLEEGPEEEVVEPVEASSEVTDDEEEAEQAFADRPGRRSSRPWERNG